MIFRNFLMLMVAGALAGAAFAHADVQNAHVKARMDAMSAIGAATKVLGEMAKGSAEFDTDTAQAAIARIATHAAKVPDLFEVEASDPMSEALPEIWINWEDFVARAEALEQVADKLEINAPEDVGPALGALGATCKACHSDYRT